MTNLTKIVFFLLLFSTPLAAAAEPLSAPAALPEVSTYGQLVSQIRKVKDASRTRLEQAVEQEKVREAWETGRLIDAHVLQQKERAEYGKQVLERLAKDLETSQTELSFMVQFARAYPIYSPANKLSWSHYRELLSLNDEKARKEFTEKVEKENWSRDRLREEIRRRNAKTGIQDKPEKLPEAKPGQLYTYRVVKAAAGPDKGSLVLDLGFANYFNGGPLGKFKEGDVVVMTESRASGGTKEQTLRQLAKPGKDDLYNYNAYVTEVIDGDTFTVLIDLGFGVTTRQKLRLRALDAREIESAEGREAKEFFEKAVKKSGGRFVVRTAKSDKYDRYLADVFTSEGKYLNGELVESGLAVVVKE